MGGLPFKAFFLTLSFKDVASVGRALAQPTLAGSPASSQ